MHQRMHQVHVAQRARAHARVEHGEPVAALLLQVRGDARRVDVVEEVGRVAVRRLDRAGLARVWVRHVTRMGMGALPRMRALAWMRALPHVRGLDAARVRVRAVAVRARALPRCAHIRAHAGQRAIIAATSAVLRHDGRQDRARRGLEQRAEVLWLIQLN